MQGFKEVSGCGLAGVINKKGELIPGEVITRMICNQRIRGNGLGSGFAAYGIYPDFKDHYALHVMYGDASSVSRAEEMIDYFFEVRQAETMPTRKVHLPMKPLLKRYFVERKKATLIGVPEDLSDDDYVVHVVMKINAEVDGAFVFSSGKNMGVFKGVGFPDEIAEFYRIDEYKGYIWIAHTRFPTNTPGWWGGAHPFSILDWAIVHNGELSSYGINKRYLEMFGYKCTLMTDTEVVAYLLDLLIRRHGLSYKWACACLAPPFWKTIYRMDDEERKVYSAIRMVYGSAQLNGPFAIIFSHSKGMVGLNDRVKLRPFIVGVKDSYVYMASEEAAIREVEPALDRVWAPPAGDPVIVSMEVEV